MVVPTIAHLRNIDAIAAKQNMSHNAQIDKKQQMKYTVNNTTKTDIKQNFSKGIVTYDGS